MHYWCAAQMIFPLFMLFYSLLVLPIVQYLLFISKEQWTIWPLFILFNYFQKYLQI